MVYLYLDVGIKYVCHSIVFLPDMLTSWGTLCDLTTNILPFVFPCSDDNFGMACVMYIGYLFFFTITILLYMEKINIYGNFVHIVYFNKYDGVYVMFFIYLCIVLYDWLRKMIM